jgi:hypothetical protein
MIYAGDFGRVAQPVNGLGPWLHSVKDSFSRRLTSVERGSGIAVEDGRTRPEQTLRQRRLEKIQVLISGMSMHLPKGFAAGLNDQFATMLADDVWEDGDEFPSMRSVTVFLLVLFATGTKVRPGIGTNGRGSITAFWREGENRLTIDCLPTGSTRWVLTRVNSTGQAERAAAECLPERIRDVLNAYRPEVWFGQ